MRFALGLARMATAAWLATASVPALAQRWIGFYAPWDPASVASLRAHGADLAVVVPAWISVTGPDHQVTIAPDVPGRAALAGLHRDPKLWIMIQNASLGSWDGAGTASLMRDPVATGALLGRIEAEAVGAAATGLVIDFEDLPPAAQPDLRVFLARARDRARRHGWTLAVTAPVADPAWDLAAIGQVVDRVILMAYDEHWQTGPPGPIASDRWFRSAVARAVAQVPRGRSVVAIASYAYDWPANGPATVLSVDQAEALAAQAGAPLVVDPESGATHFAYAAGGIGHQVWIANAATAGAQAAIARAAGAANVALWRLGTEDGRLWSRSP
ncbi:glycosyl hydrolase family 18 protein [uncultured Sphingomonas sp.]|uniref:glycosyl hydrolase family 18 protein n=1 Tax=uncultured Sphingomonas sp. TaxID=158754 RepID=UPI0035CB9160